MTGAERKALRALWTTRDHTTLPADKGKSTVVLNPVDYNQTLVSSLGTHLIEGLLRTPQRRSNTKPQFSLRSKHLQKRFANYYVPWRLYGLSKILTEGVLLRPVVNNIVVTSYKLPTYVSDRHTKATRGALCASREKLHPVFSHFGFYTSRTT